MNIRALEDIHQVEVTRVSRNGFWVSLRNEEMFLPFEHFPWFRDAPLRKLVNVQRLSNHSLYWPDLDIDLELESISYPEPVSLVSNDEAWLVAE